MFSQNSPQRGSAEKDRRRYREGMRVAAFVLIMSMQISAQVLDPKTYSTTGKPTEAMATPDGQYVLVTVDTGGSSGIDVFHLEGDKLKRTAFQALGNDGAQGILLLPGTRTLAVGLSNQGVAFLPLDEALTGKAKVNVLPQGDRSGTGYLAATPDGQFLFAANEYGDGGNTSVIPKPSGIFPPLAQRRASRFRRMARDSLRSAKSSRPTSATGFPAATTRCFATTAACRASPVEACPPARSLRWT